ncbi:hypothetical protein Bca52824_065098 [Brassica carinata]|uniref:Uncharacterized protein n=1 Tax=Brassica carinata TaxID=52824 RepID=A0A8X7QMQ4_BRACI|nr:hypothetical protein Bca52824_065098 [Brassica carinata]
MIASHGGGLGCAAEVNKAVESFNKNLKDLVRLEASESLPPTMWNKLFDLAVGKLTVLSVLRMLGNEYLAVEKRLPLALIALVDGVLCPRMQKYSEVKWFTAFVVHVSSIAFAWLQLSVHFTVIPDEERLLLVDQNEDRQVTSLVQKLLCGETFKPEDFPGGDQSFSPKFKVPDAAHEEGALPTPVRQRNLRPRNTAIEVEDISSSETAEKRIVNAREVGANATLGREAMDDPRSASPPSPDDSIVSETEGNRKGKKERLALRHVGKKCCLGVDLEEVSRKNTPSSERESGHQNDDDHAKASMTMRFPPSAETKAIRLLTQLGDGQQQETQSNALVLFGDVLVVEPESYVLPAEHRGNLGGMAEKTNVPCVISGSDAGRSAREGGEGHKMSRCSTVGYESVKHQIRMMERLEQVSAPMGIVEALVKEINSEIPGNEGGRCTAKSELVAAMTPAAGLTFAAGADNGGESVKHQIRMMERLEQVSAPMGFVEALVKEINSEIPGGRAGGDSGGEFVEEDPGGGEEARAATNSPNLLTH